MDNLLLKEESTSDEDAPGGGQDLIVSPGAISSERTGRAPFAVRLRMTILLAVVSWLLVGAVIAFLVD